MNSRNQSGGIPINDAPVRTSVAIRLPIPVGGSATTQGPNFKVPPGAFVYLRNDIAGINVNAANSPAQAATSTGLTVLPQQQIAYPCANLNEIFVGAAGPASMLVLVYG
jgi:hypothetical protein